MSDKKKDQIIDQIQKQVEKLREQSEAPESGFEDVDLVRQIERANKKLTKPPKKEWIH